MYSDLVANARKKQLCRLQRRGEHNIKVDLRRCVLDLTDSGQGRLPPLFEQGNEPSGFKEFLDHLNK
jgi:hypothetical protein